MDQTEKLSLVNGTFKEDEAREILMNLFSTKIHFHELKNFSAQERFGHNDATAEKRIPELKEGMEKAMKIFSEAKVKNKSLIVTSEICISLVDD
jgi:predicted RecB family nuclease